jgi:hypothetical protein
LLFAQKSEENKETNLKVKFTLKYSGQIGKGEQVLEKRLDQKELT